MSDDLDPTHVKGSLENLLWSDAVYRHYSASTKNRLLGAKAKFFSKEESLFWKRSGAFLLFGREEMEKCAKSGAHLSCGVMAMALFDCLLCLHLIDRKQSVVATRTFQAEVEQMRKHLKKGARTRARVSLVTVLRQARSESLHRLLRDLHLLNDNVLGPDEYRIVAEAGYPKDVAGALKFLRETRNHIHPPQLAKQYSQIVPLEVFEPRPVLDDYYYNFAYVAVRMEAAMDELERTTTLLPRPF